MEDNKFERNELLINTTIKSLEKRNFAAFYCKDKKEAVEKILELTNKDETFSWGGSVTLDEIGIKQELKEKEYKVFDRDSAKTPQERKELVIKGLTADNFLMSANAISKDGEIVNIDGYGSRISALCFGPKKVFIIAGANKIVDSLDSAIKRARNIAAPINAKRVSAFFDVDTPCLKTGVCMDCKSETSICTQILITRLSCPKGRINVLLVNEDLGY